MAELADKVAELSRDIDYLKSTINGHVSEVGERAHGLPQSGSAGFMPYNLYQGGVQEFESRTAIPDKTDPTTLDPGYYYGANMINIPDMADVSAGAVVDVTRYGGKASNQKVITYRQAALNLTWVKVINNPGGEDKAWQRVMNVAPLWSGTLSSTGIEQTLNESISHYSFVLINFGSTSNNHNTVIVPENYVGNGISLDTTNLSSDGFITTIEARMVVDSGTTFKLATNQSLDTSSTTGAVTTGSAKLIVNSIWGVF
ncbi:hypothetical protein [Lactiplantibacillus plantarum]|uniref:hypothetical protein n=1 Tax=Lactiplantibacillus plantarum TaxID=1590 RepID=UPI000C9F4081|nr:hypothetical protein [Lactiplantibacillus plantarum]AUS71667.1 hypothetical protein C1T23_00963 [Lactiplantibacillus plantarum]USZ11453.1 hypothetical protein NHN79_10310 [Lactiplantibacillus plantarum]UVE93277.1 hypothetical protein KE630_05900 [Lactiplantibacillus plantarum]